MELYEEPFWADFLNVDKLQKFIKATDENEHYWPYSTSVDNALLILEYSKRCKSPIEEILFWALAKAFKVDGLSEGLNWLDVNLVQSHITPRTHGDNYREAWREWWDGHKIIPQYFYAQQYVNIGNQSYYPDFSFYCVKPPNLTPTTWIHIEADGHEYHEKTKKQAQRDKSRDRILMSQEDTKVLHYTGSEIYKDVNAVVEDIMQHVYKKR